MMGVVGSDGRASSGRKRERKTRKAESFHEQLSSVEILESHSTERLRRKKAQFPTKLRYCRSASRDGDTVFRKEMHQQYKTVP